MKTYATKCWEKFLVDIKNNLSNGKKDFENWEAIKKSQTLDDGLLNKYLDLFEKNIIEFDKLKYIFEFGPGHGRLCKLIHERGFDGRYVCFDFPEMIEIQKIYLGDIKPVYIYDLKDVEDPWGSSLFISMSALEEAPMVIHKWFFDNYVEYFDCWLFKFSGRKDMFDNLLKDKYWIEQNDMFRDSVYLKYGINRDAD